MTTWIYIFAVCVGLLLAISYLHHLRRAAAIRSLATRLGLRYSGQTLPGFPPLSGTSLDGITSTWNIIDGERHGIRVVAFDCRIGSGKGSWRRTVIAAESGADIFRAAAFNLDLTVDRSGSWIILYQPKTVSLIPPGLMPLTELEAHLNAI